MFFLLLMFFNICILVCVRFYCILTSGINKCSKHLVGKVAIVTGGSTGIGFETAKDLAFRGARVIIACNSTVNGSKARNDIIATTNNQDVCHHYVDLASFASVRKFAAGILKTEKQLHILINNAGVIDTKNSKSEDGVSLGMQINYFGPFLLTNLLLPLLKSSAPSRIINVSSMAYRFGRIDFKNFETVMEDSLNFLKVYSISKLCLVLLTLELERRLRHTKVTANCLHPGTVYTNILFDISSDKWWCKCLNYIGKYIVKSPAEGAQTSVYLAVAPELSEVSGQYFSDCQISPLSQQAQDPDLARKLWNVSERVVKIK